LLLLAKLTLCVAVNSFSFICSVEHTALISGNHILDVDERVLAAVLLKHLESSLDEVTEVHLFPLTVDNRVADVLVALLEQVEDGQDLAVIGDQSLTNGLGAEDERLKDLKSDDDNLRVACVQGSYTKQLL